MNLAPFLFLSGGILGVLTILSQVALWQRKEYRLDRLLSSVLSPEGSLVKQPMVLLASGLVGLGWVFALTLNFTFANVCGWIALGAYALFHAHRIATRGVFRPKMTLKAMLIIAASLISSVAITLGPIDASQTFPLAVATFIFFLPFVVAICAVALTMVGNIQKKSVITKAKKLRASNKTLTVIGITGSYGKTSTKEFLLHILKGSDKKVTGTRAHRNEEFTVAQDMLEQLNQSYDVYVAEMGAYKKGEIAALSLLAKPSIGILTAIGNQHVSLFGSREALAAAKWELIDGLPKDGVAVLNADNDVIVRKAKGIQKKVIWYSIEKEADVYASDIVVHPTHLEATLLINSHESRVSIPIVSKGLLSSVVGAIAGAVAAGMSPEAIVERLATLPHFPQTMEVTEGMSGSIIIDDSYSASREAVTNALEHLNVFPQTDKRIVLVPIIELGDEGEQTHQDIGAALSKIDAKVYIYGLEYQQSIKQGLGTRPKAAISWVTDAKELTNTVAQGATKDTVFLLEGRIPALTRTTLLQKK